MSSTIAPPAARADAAPAGAELRIGLVLVIALFLSVVLRTAWVSDDAFIDARTAVHAAAGEGLRWNVDDRVQTFADPAWVLLLSGASTIVRDPYVALLLLDITCAALAVVLIVAGVAVDAAAALLALSLLTFSKAFVEFVTSGLSVALVYLLIAAFWSVHWRIRDSRVRMTALAAIAAVGALTDAKTVLLFVPALMLALRRRNEYQLSDLVLPIAIVISWVIFAALYYGSAVPVPIVAAWTESWSLPARIGQGSAYVLDALDRDPLTVLAIGCAVATLGVRHLAPVRVIAVGIGLYCAWVVVAGGDSLSGRALAPALLSAAILASRFEWMPTGYAVPAIAVAVWGIGLMSPYSPVRSDVHYGRTAADALPAPWPNMPATIAPARAAIRDERRSIYPQTGLLTAKHDAPLPDSSAIEQEVQQILARNERVVVTDRVGLFAFVADSRLHIIDPLGRTDPLLARLPPVACCTARGDARAIPDGYVETIETGRNVIADTRTADLFRRISTLTPPAPAVTHRLRASSP